MNALNLLLAAASLSIVAEAGCKSNDCTAEDRVHTIEVTRDFSTTDAATSLQVEACLGSQCKTATPAADGTFTITKPLGELGPTNGTVTASADPTNKRVSVSYGILESSLEPLVLRVKRGAVTLLDETATVSWDDEECHPAPRSTKL